MKAVFFLIYPASAEFNPMQMEFVKHSVQIYKDFIRPILTDCAVVEIEKNVRGALTAFALAGRNSLQIKFKGMRHGRKYRVTLDNTGETFEMDGREQIEIYLHGSYTSELVLYEEI